MIDNQIKIGSGQNSLDSARKKESEAHGEMDTFTLKRLCDEKLSVASATRLLNNIRLWYPETEEIISQANFKNRGSVLEAVKKVREIFL